jgi:hypothetical protein
VAARPRGSAPRVRPPHRRRPRAARRERDTAGRERLRLPPPEPAPGEDAARPPGALAGQLTLTLEGEDGAYLEPAFRFESNRALEPVGQIVVPLVEIGRRQGAGRTVVEIERPGGVVPDVLRVETRTGSFERPIAVWDEGPAGRATQIGSGTLRRLEGAWRRHGGERWLEGGPDTDQREVELLPARGERLRVEITDADSPPLDALGFAAVVRQPTLFFSATATAGYTPAATLYFGGGRVQAARYDLAGLAPLLRGDVAGERVPEAVRLRDLSRIDKAELRDVRPNPALATTPVLAYAMRPGAELDTRLYSHRRAFTVRPSTAGLARLRLEPEDLAETRPDLADVRVVDAAGRQWPYLLERDTAEKWESLGVTPPERRRGRSRHTLRLPLAPLRLDRLVLEVDTRFFDRPFRLVAPDADDTERAIAQGRLARGADGKSLVTVAFPAARVDALVLVVEDGDDAPLVLRSARVRLPLPELYLAAPAGQYALLVGNPDATAPSYDLARVRDAMLAVKSVPAVASESVPNPAYSARARATSGEGSQKLLPQVALWAVLIGAVAVLTVITLRLARRGEDAGS